MQTSESIKTNVSNRLGTPLKALYSSLFLLMLFFAPYSESWTALWLTTCDWNQDLWRYVSAHFTHWNLSHLTMNMAGLMIYIWLFMDDMNHKSAFKEQSVSILFILVISDSYLLTCYKLATYAGFSGILYGLFAFGSIRYWKSNPLICNLIILVLVLQLQPWLETTSFIAEQGIVIAKNVHLVAVLSAIPVAVFFLFKEKKPRLLT